MRNSIPRAATNVEQRKRVLLLRRAALAILIGFPFSAGIRWAWRREPVVANIEASYHVLLTVQALSQTPAAVHRFLPIVTLGRSHDRDVRFGASVRGPGGIYYYTSFPPLGFVAPWAFFQLTGLAPTIDHLLIFNLLIHLIATFLLVRLIVENAEALRADERATVWIAALAAGSYLFNREALYSHGVVYWHHSLFQVVWLLQLTLAARVLRAGELGVPIGTPNAIGLVVTSALGPAIEWSGYLATFGTAIVCWWGSRRTHHVGARRLAWATFAAGIIAGIALVVHFTWVIGAESLRQALQDRAAFRSAAHGSTFLLLLRGYVDSLGTLLPLVAIAGALFVLTRTARIPSWTKALCVVAAIPLGENVLMSQHAVLYQYDRLKGVVLVIAGLALMTTLLSERWRSLAIGAWLGALLWTTSHVENTRGIVSVPRLSINDSLVNRVRSVARPCALYATDGVSRGWVNLTAGGNTYETVPNLDSVRALVHARAACQGIYYTVAHDYGEVMYLWRRAIVVDGGSMKTDTIGWFPPEKRRIQ